MGHAEISCTHIGLWLNPTSAMSLVYHLVFSCLSLSTYYIEMKKKRNATKGAQMSNNS